ncbi:MAG: N-6 DNA methylase [Bacilli bacterium]|nr:N-6 DNA methylase [Bacilli bacterium]
MANEKMMVWNLFNRTRGYLSFNESLELFISCAFEELDSRGEIKHRFDIDSKLNGIHIDKGSESTLRKELKDLSSEEIRGSLIELINQVSIYAGKLGCDTCPTGICNLAINLLRINGGDMVYDLGSGLGYFLAKTLDFACKKGLHLKDLHGLEINARNANVSRMVLSILDAEYYDIKVGNGLEQKHALYNKAFTFPPINMRLPELGRKEQLSFSGFKFSTRNSSEWIFVDRLISGLTGNDRRAVAVMAPKCLFNEADQEYRDTLLKNGLIESIIELPAGCLIGTTIKCCLVVFSENNKEVKVVDASNVLGADPTRFMNVELPVDKIMDLIADAPKMSVGDLVGSHTLMPSQLLIKNKMAPVNGKPLCELADVFTGCQYTIKNFEDMFSENETGYRILTSSDINDGAVDWDKLPCIKYEDSKFDKYAIQKDDVIVTSKSSKVKVCVVDIEPKEKILVTGGMIIVRPDTSKLKPTYLKLYLDSANGQLALKSIQRGATIITINAKDLSSIIIPEASLDKQEIVTKKYNSKLTTYLALKEEIKRIENSLNNLYSEEFEEE